MKGRIDMSGLESMLGRLSVGIAKQSARREPKKKLLRVKYASGFDPQKILGYAKNALELLEEVPWDESGDVCTSSPEYRAYDSAYVRVVQSLEAPMTNSACSAPSPQGSKIFELLQVLYTRPAKTGGHCLFVTLSQNARKLGMTEEQKATVTKWRCQHNLCV